MWVKYFKYVYLCRHYNLVGHFRNCLHRKGMREKTNTQNFSELQHGWMRTFLLPFLHISFLETMCWDMVSRYTCVCVNACMLLPSLMLCINCVYVWVIRCCFHTLLNMKLNVNMVCIRREVWVFLTPNFCIRFIPSKVFHQNKE